MAKSYKVVSSKTGEYFMAIIVSDGVRLKTLNDLFRNGMNVTVTDERSHMVNKKVVDV